MRNKLCIMLQCVYKGLSIKTDIYWTANIPAKFKHSEMLPAEGTCDSKNVDVQENE